MTFAIFDEGFYLASYPDVKAAVDTKRISSGLQHFQQYGLTEGRTRVSPFYDEQLYLRKYPDVANAVRPGVFKSGLQHYIQYGETEGRSPGTFNELAYRQTYPDVAAAIAAGAFSSGLQHYIRYGQFESNLFGIFTGTTGNDTITGFSSLVTSTNILGIVVQNTTPTGPGKFSYSSSTFGTGEVDTLIGGPGRDVFYLGDNTEFASTGRSFYVGNGSADYAIIRNFSRGNDAILLGGSSLSSYNLQPVNGNLNISTSAGDLIGIVEGVTSLSQLLPETDPFTIQIG